MWYFFNFSQILVIYLRESNCGLAPKSAFAINATFCIFIVPVVKVSNASNSNKFTKLFLERKKGEKGHKTPTADLQSFHFSKSKANFDTEDKLERYFQKIGLVVQHDQVHALHGENNNKK